MVPSYVGLLNSGELRRRVSVLDDRLDGCDLCPWQCGVDRRAGETKVCQGGYLPQVSSWAPHFGEEPALSGTHLGKGQAKGTGNVFLSRCNLRCVYCQNWQISQPGGGQEQSPGMEFERLASILLELQAAGCHNIGFVSPTHFVPQIVRSVEQAASAGLRLPLIYNTNAYDDVGVLRLLEGVFDIYLPDLRYSEDAVALEYSKVPGYVQHSRAALAEMYRQVGDELVTDERGLVQRGLDYPAADSPQRPGRIAGDARVDPGYAFAARHAERDVSVLPIRQSHRGALPAASAPNPPQRVREGGGVDRRLRI